MVLLWALAISVRTGLVKIPNCPSAKGPRLPVSHRIPASSSVPPAGGSEADPDSPHRASSWMFQWLSSPVRSRSPAPRAWWSEKCPSGQRRSCGWLHPRLLRSCRPLRCQSAGSLPAVLLKQPARTVRDREPGIPRSLPWASSRRCSMSHIPLYVPAFPLNGSVCQSVPAPKAYPRHRKDNSTDSE